MRTSEPWDDPGPRKPYALVWICLIALAFTLGYFFNKPKSPQLNTENTSAPETTAYVNPYVKKSKLREAVNKAAEVDASLGPDAYQGTNWLLSEGGYSEEELFDAVKPSSGQVFKDLLFKNNFAPLEIITSGSGGYYFVLDPIHITCKPTGNAARDQFNQYRLNSPEIFDRMLLTFYVDAGDSIEFKIPLGEYEIYFASGEHWYNEKYLFGIETTYSKCDGTFVFEEKEGSYIGCTIRLEPVENGNLETYVIDKESFPLVPTD